MGFCVGAGPQEQWHLHAVLYSRRHGFRFIRQGHNLAQKHRDGRVHISLRDVDHLLFGPNWTVQRLNSERGYISVYHCALIHAPIPMAQLERPTLRTSQSVSRCSVKYESGCKALFKVPGAPFFSKDTNEQF